MSVSLPFLGYLSGFLGLDKAPRQGNRPMELTSSFVDLLPQFSPVFTAPTYQTFVAIVAGWVLSQRHRFITEVIFSSGHVGHGHWSRFHRFFSHAAWDLDTLSLFLARLVVTILAPGAALLWAVDDTLCRKRGLTLYGAGMHYDPLISSRPKALVSWGHDWVVLCLIIVHPFWAPTKVFALPIAARLYITRGRSVRGNRPGPPPKPTPRPPATPRPKPRRIPIIARDRSWASSSSIWRPDGSPTMRSSSSATAPMEVEASCLTCPPRVSSSAESIPRRRSTNRHRPRPRRPQVGLERRAIVCRAWPSGPRTRASPGHDSISTSSGCMRPWTSRRFQPSTTNRAGTDC